jgi:transcriptional regulator with XRE-family HTH domain
MTTTQIAHRWLALRKRLNMDQSEFAELALTSRSTISRIETGESQLKYGNVRAIERALGSPISVLLGDDSMPIAPDWYHNYLKLNAIDRRMASEIIQATLSAITNRSSKDKRIL